MRFKVGDIIYWGKYTNSIYKIIEVDEEGKEYRLSYKTIDGFIPLVGWTFEGDLNPYTKINSVKHKLTGIFQ